MQKAVDVQDFRLTIGPPDYCSEEQISSSKEWIREHAIEMPTRFPNMQISEVREAWTARLEQDLISVSPRSIEKLCPGHPWAIDFWGPIEVLDRTLFFWVECTNWGDGSISTLRVQIVPDDPTRNKLVNSKNSSLLEELVNAANLSPSKLAKLLDQTVMGYGYLSYQNQHSMQFELSNWDLTFIDLFQLVNDLLHELVRLRKAGRAVGANPFTQQFLFNPEIANAAEQYLIYFGQFLADIGVEAETSVARSDEVTILSIVPKNKEAALELIHEALRTYLTLPSDPELQSSLDQNQDVASIQLRANLHHLQGQVLVAQAALQLKDATIQQQRTHIDLLSARDITPQKPSPKPGDEEPVLGGLVNVGQIGPKSFKVNLGELARRYKRSNDDDE